MWGGSDAPLCTTTPHELTVGGGQEAQRPPWLTCGVFETLRIMWGGPDAPLCTATPHELTVRGAQEAQRPPWGTWGVSTHDKIVITPLAEIPKRRMHIPPSEPDT